MPIDPNESSLFAEVSLEDERGGVVDEPCFRLLFLGDWSGDAEKADGTHPIEIDRDNFDETMARLGTRLDLAIGGRTLGMEFRALDDFHPDEIYHRVTLFAEFRELRRRLNNENTFFDAAREVRSMFDTPKAEEATPAETAAEKPTDLLDAILMHPEGGETPPTPGVSSELSELVRSVVRPHLTYVDEAEKSVLVAAVDAATSSLMRTILHSRKFQALEAAWRGLYSVVRHTATSVDLKLYIADLSKDALTDQLKSADKLSATPLHKTLIADTLDTPGVDPWTAVIGNYAFTPDVEDIATLMRLSKICSAAGAPFVDHIRPDLFGVHSLAGAPEPGSWKISAETDAGKLWTLIRGQAESAYLGMVIPRFLARLPYGAKTSPLETFSFEEFTDGSVHDDLVWSNGSFAFARLLAESFSVYGWEMGRSLKTDIEGLPLYVYSEGTETVFTPCSEIWLTEAGCEKLLGFGLMPLISFKNSDRVKLARYQSIADPPAPLKGRWN